MLFDSHAHLDDSKFDADRDQILENLERDGVGLLVNAASDIQTAKTGMLLAEKYRRVYFAAGIHPQEADNIRTSDFKELESLLAHPKCVALGEIGLDYYYDEPPRDTQKKIFYRQLEMAAEKNMPVVIHDREAHADCLQAVRETGAKGVFHCFSGSPETALELVELGFYISFAGVVTFKNSRRAVEAVSAVPVDRILIETDSPYLSPEPFRGKRNEPRNVVYTARKIAEIKDMPFERVADITFNNAVKLFGISACKLQSQGV